jgi:hypothetical protein
MTEDDKDFDGVSAPTHLDGSPVDKDEAARVHSGLVTGEMKVEMAEGVAEELEALGLTPDDIKQMLIAAAKKTMS